MTLDLIANTNIDELVITGGAIVAGLGSWWKFMRPFVKTMRAFYIRLNRFLDQHEELVGVVLEEREFVDGDGKIVKKPLAELVLQLIEWQIEHDRRWPSDPASHLKSPDLREVTGAI